MKNWLKM